MTWFDYDYAIVRLVPRVHLEAFVNVGVVLHSRTARFLDVRLLPDEALADVLPRCAAPLDPALVTLHLEGYRRVCTGGAAGGAVGLLPASERFHWLTAPRSAVLQTSAVRPGRCLGDPAAALDHLFAQVCG